MWHARIFKLFLQRLRCLDEEKTIQKYLSGNLWTELHIPILSLLSLSLLSVRFMIAEFFATCAKRINIDQPDKVPNNQFILCMILLISSSVFYLGQFFFVVLYINVW